MTVVVNAFFEVRNATLTPRSQYKIWDLALLCGLFHHRLRYKYAFDRFFVLCSFIVSPLMLVQYLW